ncbi:LptF/LptG family permease [Stappia taiwanensis]|uniref:LptF/LptG family permease n=1 Tax=Stappia taiwanensis TaxID=992267 RepID=A0A838XVH9_9HYPH|nr:LptF/LptG family permease [Stappia taiwanensis]MBA4612496.1 LptF/LptG family permease [Stappia taiwanensis]GGF05815.1 hypothetical protein GCM10007285_37110 [Stappia taiwanensis]
MRIGGVASRALMARILAKVVIVVATIEVVFLAEKLTGILEEVLGNGGGIVAALSILVLTSPEIFDFALALACVIGVYFALVAAREERELVALSAAGVSWSLALKVVLVVGVLAFGASLLVSGFLNPLAASTNRAVVFNLTSDLLFRRITEPSEGTLIETIRGKTFAALSDSSVSPPHESLFVHQPGEDGAWRVTQAEDWKLIGPDAQGNYNLGLGRVNAYDFKRIDESGSGAVSSSGRGPNLRALAEPDIADVPMLPLVRVENVEVPVSLRNILRYAARSEVAEEWTFAEALWAQGASDTAREAREIAAERYGRALAALVAPVMALVACVLAQGGLSNFFVMPAACAALLAFDLVLRSALADLAGKGAWTMVGGGVAMAVAALLLLGVMVRVRRHSLLRPVGQRA